MTERHGGFNVERESWFCGCEKLCGDDGDTDGPGTCKGLPQPPKPPLVEIVLVPRGRGGA